MFTRSLRDLRTHSMTTRSVEQDHNGRAAVGYQLTVVAMQNEIRSICRPDLAAFRECALAELRAKILSAAALRTGANGQLDPEQ